ncbi:hypothetical protein AZI98_04575 [Aeribacillus pallidus]|uniref:Prepilin-type N-terminal cleavage/methylation domain-containing protein n=1 Tax=Aeribacillus pallidus TaxID=33936 RepID=A0A165Y9F4_9BACI|nr:prepilin-type N-terminal cleavage/methylation domain-containing protein [Aeribacillus pallidus]KZN96860.1 hypothetical protein AZI98_04575 [Aeribacillus pallidus]
MRKHVKLLKKEKGMTLIELLAVIIIIAIILAIAIPIITNVIGDSKNRANVSEALNIISAAKLKHAQEGGTEYNADALKGYIDFQPSDSNFKVSFENKTWNIFNHPAVSIVGGKDASSVTEGELRKYLR